MTDFSDTLKEGPHSGTNSLPTWPGQAPANPTWPSGPCPDGGGVGGGMWPGGNHKQPSAPGGWPCPAPGAGQAPGGWPCPAPGAGQAPGGWPSTGPGAGQAPGGWPSTGPGAGQAPGGWPCPAPGAGQAPGGWPSTGPGAGQAPGGWPSTGPGAGQAPGGWPSTGPGAGQAPGGWPSTGPGAGQAPGGWPCPAPGAGQAPGWPSTGPGAGQAPGGWPSTGPGAGQAPGGWPSTGPGPPQQSLKLPYNENLPSGVYDKMLIIITGTIKPCANKITVDLLASSDVAFHFNPRFKDNGKKTVVRNSCIGRRWGKEERELTNFPFAEGRPFEIKILCTNREFKVAVNNDHLLEYRHRVTNLRSINKLSIYNDLTLSKVSVNMAP